MTQSDPDRRGYLTTDRLEALTDGVFSIAMTLLVLELRVPLPSEAAQIGPVLFAMWPIFLGYLASFVNLGIYWVGQNNQFHYIRYTDRLFLWMHLCFLFFVTLIPFSTAILGRYPNEQLSYIVYGLNLVFIGSVTYSEWCYATHYHRLVLHTTKDEVVAYVKRRIILAPIVCLIAMLLSYINIVLSLLLFVVIPVYYIWPNTRDENWLRPAKPHDHDEHEEHDTVL